MHRNLIKHFLRVNKDLILEKSLINCHARGLDSVLLDDTPGERIRIFFAIANHELWKNTFRGQNQLSIAFHPHHCDLTLECIYGQVQDIHIELHKDTDRWDKWTLNKYIYKSNINTGEIGFEYSDSEIVCLSYSNILEPESDYGDGVSRSAVLKASDLHTIFVPKNHLAAWVVYEGKENPDYSPICYSNADLTKFDKSGMYQPMTEDYLYSLLKGFKLI